MDNKFYFQMTHLKISLNKITSLRKYFDEHPDIDKNKIEIFDCSFNNLISLEGCPPNVRELYCGTNYISSFEGCPPSVEKLHINHNFLKTLKGCPPNVKILNCSWNMLTTLNGCPPNLEELNCYGQKCSKCEHCDGYCPKFEPFNEIPPSVNLLIANKKQTRISFSSLSLILHSSLPKYNNKTIEEIHKINLKEKYNRIEILFPSNTQTALEINTQILLCIEIFSILYIY